MAEHSALNYWRVLGQLILIRDVVNANLDIKLEQAISDSSGRQPGPDWWLPSPFCCAIQTLWR